MITSKPYFTSWRSTGYRKVPNIDRMVLNCEHESSAPDYSRPRDLGQMGYTIENLKVSEHVTVPQCEDMYRKINAGGLGGGGLLCDPGINTQCLQAANVVAYVIKRKRGRSKRRKCCARNINRDRSGNVWSSLSPVSDVFSAGSAEANAAGTTDEL